MKRIFIAVKVNPEETFLKMINSFKTALFTENIKWINPENIHITLAFLGDTEEKLIKDINSMLDKVCRNLGNFELVFSEISMILALYGRILIILKIY